MATNPSEVRARLAEQCRRQDRLDRARMTWWIPWIFVAGLVVSGFGLYASVVSVRATGRVWLEDVAFAVFFVMFALAVGGWLTWPLRIAPRIVPYFARELGPVGGGTYEAFRRGRGTYLAIAELEELAAAAGVTPLSAFGFTDDFYEQEVRWHPAAEGLRTVEVLREKMGGNASLPPALAEDLNALAAVLRIAADRGVAFALTVRLYGRDDYQVVATMQPRQGSFW